MAFRKSDRLRLIREKQRRAADRYGRHPSKLDTAAVYRILADDAVARTPTPLPWFLAALDVLAAREKSHPEIVFERIRQDCIARIGRDMPMAG